MRTVDEYRAKALEFEEIAIATTHPELKRCYRDLAKSYRALAEVRQRAIGDGSFEPHMLLQRTESEISSS
jgi:hypothetical protein